MIDRRKLLGAATLGAAGLATTACSQSASEGDGVAAPAVRRRKTRLTMTTTWPKDLPGLGAAAQRVADRINALSDGQMEVNVYAAGELVPAFEAFDAVASGNADMYHGADYYWQSKSKAYNFFTAVPMGMTAGRHILKKMMKRWKKHKQKYSCELRRPSQGIAHFNLLLHNLLAWGGVATHPVSH